MIERPPTTQQRGILVLLLAEPRLTSLDVADKLKMAYMHSNGSSQASAALRRLEARGLVERSRVREGDDQPVSHWSITEKGEAALG